MPEAVTTQHETLWIGVNRSAMVRVPYVVSSPEIAGPVQPIDATNLASDMRVYIPGIKDYSGDLVWEANSQRYRPGELRDLLAMDGCHVWAERRMPMVGVRVCIEGEASVSLSAADPDGVQRVTIRIAPSAPMAVEEWSGDTSEGYLVRIRTDSTGADIVDVSVGYGGRPLSTVVTSSTRGRGAASVPDEWRFGGGVGPFGCWYGAFNIDGYVAGTESEEPVCVEAGRLAYRLDPYDLGRTLAGTALTGTYNIMLVVPTVYWKTDGVDLYMSGSESFGSVSGMVAYAHTATLPGGGTRTYPYIGIGVYEAHSDGTRLLSASGKVPTASTTPDGFKALADALDSAGQSDFQQWNWWQWTLYTMMASAIIGTRNAQWALGNGPVNKGSTAGPSTTGLADARGPWADATSDFDKLLVENAWGSMYSFVGDASVSSGVLRAGNSLGGAALGGQPSTGVQAPASSGYAASFGQSAASWALAATKGAWDDVPQGGEGPADYVAASTSSNRAIKVSGYWAESTARAGLFMVSFTGAYTETGNNRGARLSAFLDDYAVGLTDDAPASLSMSAPLTLSMGQSASESDGEEVAESEPGEDAGIAEESEETPEAETIEEDMR